MKGKAKAAPSPVSSNPILGRSAWPLSGQHATAPPISVMNSRRLMSDIGSSPAAGSSDPPHVNLAQTGGKVLGPNLNRSESDHEPDAPSTIMSSIDLKSVCRPHHL